MATKEPYVIYVVASTVVNDLFDEERRRREASDSLGPDWTVVGGVPDAPAA